MLFVILIVTVILALVGYRKVQDVNRVEKYRAIVEEIIPEDKKEQQLILSIILTETKGLGTDIMQSSESMSLKQDQVLTQKDSVKFGVKHLKEMEDYGKKLGLDEWSSVQAYNFGLPYLDYLKKQHQTKYTVKYAEIYSKDYLAPTLGNKDEKTYRFFHLHSLFYNGGYLYKNGGNFFYAKIVKWNLKWIQTYESLLNLLKN